MREAWNWEKLSGGFECVAYMLGVNLCFLISSLPVLLFFLFVGISRAGTYLPLFLLCLLPMAPGLSAVFYAMNRYQDRADGGVWHDFIKGWRGSIPSSLQVGAVQLLFIFILWTNLRFFAGMSCGYILVVISGVLLLFTVLMTPNLYYFAGIYDMNGYETVRAAVTVTIGRPGTVLGSTAALLLLLAVFEVAPAVAVFFFAGIYGGLVVFMNRRLVK